MKFEAPPAYAATRLRSAETRTFPCPWCGKEQTILIEIACTNNRSRGGTGLRDEVTGKYEGFVDEHITGVSVRKNGPEWHTCVDAKTVGETA